jgi:hypothetical protein
MLNYQRVNKIYKTIGPKLQNGTRSPQYRSHGDGRDVRLQALSSVHCFGTSSGFQQIHFGDGKKRQDISKPFLVKILSICCLIYNIYLYIIVNYIICLSYIYNIIYNYMSNNIWSYFVHFSPAHLAQLRKEHAMGQLYARQSIEGAHGTSSNAYCVLYRCISSWWLVDDG